MSCGCGRSCSRVNFGMLYRSSLSLDASALNSRSPLVLDNRVKRSTRGEREFRAFWRHGRNYRPCYRGRGLWVVIINKVLTRFWVLVFGRFVLGAPDPRSWILAPQVSFLGVLSWAFCPRS
jgi:hypothetical protein